VINHKGEFCGCKFTAGNVDDREPVADITKDLFVYFGSIRSPISVTFDH
jgi:hypothetical protein